MATSSKLQILSLSGEIELGSGGKLVLTSSHGRGSHVRYDFRSKDSRNKNLAGFYCYHNVKLTLYILKDLTFTVKLSRSSGTYSQPHTEIKPWYYYPRIGNKRHWLLQAKGPEP